MKLEQVLFTQGFGTRRVCAGLLAAGAVRIAGEVVSDPGREFDTEGLVFEVDGVAWTFHAKAVLMLHKPTGYECSQKPRHHPSVMSLLPAPLRQRGYSPSAGWTKTRPGCCCSPMMARSSTASPAPGTTCPRSTR